MAAALDAMPEKVLISDELEQDGAVCALGSVGKARGMDMSNLDPYEYETIAPAFGIPEALAREIMYENDEDYRQETPEERWQRIRRWVQRQIAEEPRING
jgi:hypothetical protein